jgi:hypothetical protein
MSTIGYDPFSTVGTGTDVVIGPHTILFAAYDDYTDTFEVWVSAVAEGADSLFTGVELYTLAGSIPVALLSTLEVADATHENIGDVVLDMTTYPDVEVYRWAGTNPFTASDEFESDAAFTIKFVGFTSEEESVPFEGTVQWPHLDLGNFGTQKNLIGLDIVSDAPEGLTVSVGYDQRNLAARTTPYEIEADTLPGQIIPMPVGGPSFDLKLVFTASQRWELQAANLYLQDGRPTA